MPLVSRHRAPFAQFSELTALEKETGLAGAEEMILRLLKGQETVVRTARSILPAADEASDEPTLDLLTQRMQIHEKNAWMLRSLLKA